MTPDTFLLIGLGNPGREYRDSRHNVGFMFIDRLIVRLNARGMKVQSKAIVTSAAYEEHKLILAKPQTYMNLSGNPQGLCTSTSCPENMLVAHDDLDIPLARSAFVRRPRRTRRYGIDHRATWTKDFPRLRIGIGRPPGRMDPAAYVLQNFSRDEMKVLSEIVDRAADAALTFVTDGLNKAMNKYNGSVES
jgi:PTH1 family peptidyl-tRNA hydrolase